jgi:hypothetical protein
MKYRSKLRVSGFLVAALVWPGSNGVAAQNNYIAPFTKENISPVRVALKDGAANGCWTNLNEVKNYTEGQLELAGIEVTNENAARTYLAVEVLSERVQNGTCYGNIKVSLEGWVDWKGGRAYVELFGFDSTFLRTGNSNTLILDTVKEFSSKYFATLPEGN